MIEINLLPQELREKKKITDKFSLILYYVAAGIVVLVFINICIISLTLIKNIQFKTLSKKWQGAQQQRQKVEEFREHSEMSAGDLQAIQQIRGSRVFWASKLNALSLLLPSGIWFNELSLDNKNFVIKGSIISLKQEEMSLINLFLTNLKEDKFFSRDFASLNLTSVQRRQLGGYEISDFTFTGSLKSR